MASAPSDATIERADAIAASMIAGTDCSVPNCGVAEEGSCPSP